MECSTFVFTQNICFGFGVNFDSYFSKIKKGEFAGDISTGSQKLVFDDKIVGQIFDKNGEEIENRIEQPILIHKI